MESKMGRSLFKFAFADIENNLFSEAGATMVLSFLKHAIENIEPN